MLHWSSKHSLGSSSGNVFEHPRRFAYAVPPTIVLQMALEGCGSHTNDGMIPISLSKGTVEASDPLVRLFDPINIARFLALLPFIAHLLSPFLHFLTKFA
jgi:hypothetical protein